MAETETNGKRSFDSAESLHAAHLNSITAH